MLFPDNSTFAAFLANAFAVFAFALWLWLLMTTARDLFRRRDMPGATKFLWVILFVALPYVGVLAYVLTQGRGMAERHNAQAQKARDDLHDLLGFSAADEILKLNSLRARNAISEEEYLTLRARLVT